MSQQQAHSLIKYIHVRRVTVGHSVTVGSESVHTRSVGTLTKHASGAAAPTPGSPPNHITGEAAQTLPCELGEAAQKPYCHRALKADRSSVLVEQANGRSEDFPREGFDAALA
ncbi:hypothetical protein CRENBAI_017649 [Crenichthys baileyi]|uniref:Uncharacterized protein n=1 Tax=Crenichthys baileyi TaxID=28760 RepID=A0AAV9RQQ5_9TELE